MADTSIEWTEKVWNPIIGCTVHSPGCTNCYAMRMAWRLQGMAAAGNEALAHYAGTVTKTKAGPVWTGKIGIAPDSAFLAPLHRRTPTTYFVNSMADLFHVDVPDEMIDRVFAVMALCPQHIFQVLTKRSARMREYCIAMAGGDRSIIHNGAGLAAPGVLAARLSEAAKRNPACSHTGPLPNVWLGVSVEDQTRRERIVDLAQTPAAVRWISGEPLLEGLMLTDIPLNGGPDEHGVEWLFNALTGEQYFIGDDGRNYSGDGPQMQPLDWIVAGGESGPGARGSTAEVEVNMRSLLAQCRAAGVPFFGKQNFKKLPLPADLDVKEYPA